MVPTLLLNQTLELEFRFIHVLNKRDEISDSWMGFILEGGIDFHLVS